MNGVDGPPYHFSKAGTPPLPPARLAWQPTMTSDVGNNRSGRPPQLGAFESPARKGCGDGCASSV